MKLTDPFKNFLCFVNFFEFKEMLNKLVFRMNSISYACWYCCKLAKQFCWYTVCLYVFTSFSFRRWRHRSAHHSGAITFKNSSLIPAMTADNCICAICGNAVWFHSLSAWVVYKWYFCSCQRETSDKRNRDATELAENYWSHNQIHLKQFVKLQDERLIL